MQLDIPTNFRRPTMADFKLTYATMFNPPEELHTGFDKAVEKLKQNMGREYGMFIDGKEIFADDKFDDRSPVKHRLGAGQDAKRQCQTCTASIGSRAQGFSHVDHTPWQKRVEYLRKAASLIEERIFDLGAAMALEVGKNRMESLGDVQETARPYLLLLLPDEKIKAMWLRWAKTR